MVTNAPVSVASLWTSTRALPLKIQHIACHKAEAAHFPFSVFCFKMTQFPRWMWRYFVEKKERDCSLFLLFHDARPSYSAATYSREHPQCHQEVGEKCNTTQYSATVIVSPHLRALKTFQPGFSFFCSIVWIMEAWSEEVMKMLT